MIGKPYSGKLNVRFDEGELEIEPLATTPALYSTEDFSDLKDSDGKSFIKEILETANTQGSGWVEYKWSNPVTKEVLPKKVYFKKVDDLIICSGFYKHVVHPLKFSCI